MPEDSEPNPPPQAAQETQPQPPSRPAEPQNVLFKGSEVPRETAVQQIDGGTEER
jgi:hypothetical protein